MKPTKFRIACIILPLFVALCFSTASAAGSGTLVATDALEIRDGGDGHVLIFLNGSYDPAVRGLSLKVCYNESIAECTLIKRNSSAGAGGIPGDRSSGFNLQLIDSSDDSSGIPTGVWLWDITFKAKTGDGSRMDVGLDLTDIGASSVIKYIDVTTVKNGTFTTKDETKPVINITTRSPVSSPFTIAGTIDDVGGMVGGQSSARATLKNQTYEESFDLLPLDEVAPGYTFSKQVTWPVFEPITLTVNATDAAGNDNWTEPFTLNVVNVGFSNPEPADGSYIKAIPEYVQAVATAINPGSVQMHLGSAGSAPINLNPTIDNVYVRNTTSIDDLADGNYWVNVSGTGDGSIGGEWSLNWTFTLDTTKPEIVNFVIADSDGDGYIEAGETLTLNWVVAPAEPNFDRVALVDVATGNELWSSDSLSGTATLPPIDDGNRDLVFRAYDKAGNYDSRGFHLYYDYTIWVNSTKMGEVSGISTNYTAMKDLTRTTVSSITLYNGCTVTLPTLNQLQKNVTNVGQIPPDTYVTVDKNANITISGSDTYRNAWLLDPGKDLDFLVQVPYARNATLVLAEANESYIAELIKGGKGGMHSVNYTELIRKTAYIFIEGGWKQVEVDDDGTISEKGSSGKPVTGQTINAVLCNPANHINLHGEGYQLRNQGLDSIVLAPGDYVLAAIAMDGDRMGLLGTMPVMVMKSAERATIPSSVVQGESITVSFNSSCDHLGVILLRNVAYDGNALIDAATLGKESLRLNLTYNGVPATQKLLGNIYVSPSSGKYAVANTNQTTISTSGLDAGTYRVYMIGQSADGMVQAYEEGLLQITPGGSIAVTSVPAGAAIYLDGTDTGTVTNGTLTAVPAGSHNVTVTLAGYKSASSQVTVVAGQTATAHFDLTPVGSISVTSVPAGATIFLDGTNTDVLTNGTLTGIPAGNHTVIVKLSGYYDSTSTEVTVTANQTTTVHFGLTPTPTPPRPSGGGGGGSSGSTTSTYTSTGTLLTGSSGTVLKSVIVNADDNVANLLVPIGTKALDADGKPLSGITFNPLAEGDVPVVPTGAVFQFAGYAYEASPAGATFDPAITLTFDIPDDVWESLYLPGNQLTVKWYNPETELWEEIPTTVSPGSKTVTATVTHFSTFALFTEPLTEPVTPTETATTVPPTTQTTTPAGEQPSEGLPMTMILSIFAVVVIIAAAGYFFMMRK